MTDTELVKSYINKNFKFDSSSEHSAMFGVYSGWERKWITGDQFKDEVTSLYSDFVLEDGLSVSDYCRKWFNDHKERVFNEIYQSLRNVKVSLGPRSWQTVKDGQPFMWKMLIKEHGENYGKKIIKRIYDEWYHEQIEKVSEKLMNNGWV